MIKRKWAFEHNKRHVILIGGVRGRDGGLIKCNVIT